MTLAEIVEQLRRVEDTTSDGQWMRTDAMDELFRCGLVWRTGPDNEYLALTRRGKDLLEIVRKAEGK
jgi:hypothetical protein